MWLLLEQTEPSTRHVLLLADVSPSDAVDLMRGIRRLLSLGTEPVVLASASDGDAPLSLIARVTSSDKGCRRDDSSNGQIAIRCDLTPAAWDQVADLLEPFTVAITGHAHQYLSDDGEIEWMISTDRSW